MGIVAQMWYRCVSQWLSKLISVETFLASQENPGFRLKTGSFREQNGCWGHEKSELLRAVGCVRGQEGGLEQKEASPSSPWILSVFVVCHLLKVCGAPLGAAVSLFITACYPSPFITGPTINLARAWAWVCFCFNYSLYNQFPAC